MPVQIEISAEAMRRADRANRRALRQGLGRATPVRLAAFVEENIDAIDVYNAKTGQPKLSLWVDDALKALKGDDTKLANLTHQRLLSYAREFVAHADLTMAEIDKAGIAHHITTADSIQTRIDARAAQKSRAGTAFKSAAASVGLGLADIARYSLRLTGTLAEAPRLIARAGFRTIVKPLGDAYEATANLMGVNAPTRIATLAAVTGLAAVAQARPVDAAPHAHLFTYGKTAATVFDKSCADTRIMQSGRLTSAFAVAFGADKNAGRMHYISAMQALDHNVSPVALYLISVVETGNFRGVVAANSTAKGPYQSIDGTKLLWLSLYAQKTPYYREAKARLTAAGTSDIQRAMDETTIQAIDGTVRDFRKSPQSVIGALRASQGVTLEYNKAIELANDPVFAGQLMAAELAANAPELSLKALEGKSMPQILQAVGRYYETHLLGAGGARVLRYIAAKAPNTKLNNTAEVRRLARLAVPGMDKDFGNYFVSVANGNRGIFKTGAGVTAGTVIANIESFVANTVKPALPKLEAAMTRGTSGLQICAKDGDAIAALVPATTNSYEIAGRIAYIAYQEKLPEALRTNLEAAALGTARLATFWGQKAVPAAQAAEPDLTIEDIIRLTDPAPEQKPVALLAR